jgi:hypothetical protein
MSAKPAKAQPDKVEITVTELENGNIQIPWIDGRTAEFRDMIGEDMERIEQFRIDYDGEVPSTGLAYKMLSLLCVRVGDCDDGIELETLRKLPARQFKGVMEVFAAIAQYFRLNDIFDDGSGDADATGDDDDGGSVADGSAGDGGR